MGVQDMQQMAVNPLRRAWMPGNGQRFLKVALVTAILTIWATSIFGAEALAAGELTRVLTVGGLERSYLVHIPAELDLTRPAAVVLAFHGGGTNAQNMEEISGLNQKADKEGFIVVYPNGTGRFKNVLTFNGGNCCGYAMRNRVDDVEFARRLLDDLATRMNIDPKRVFATGMSNGAIMAYRLGSELSDRIAAIAPVAGPMGTEFVQAKRPVSVIHFHGTEDTFAPFEGGRGKWLSNTDFYSVNHSIQAWVESNGCRKEPVLTPLPDKIDDGTTVTLIAHDSGKDGAEVVLVKIAGGGHTWPGRKPPRRILGRSTLEISANDLMWEFFRRHKMP